MEVCEKKKEKSRLTQSHITFTKDGVARNWEYSCEVARVQLICLLARLDLPLRLGEPEAWDLNSHPIWIVTLSVSMMMTLTNLSYSFYPS
jgi:hypothetical protein